MHRQPLNVEPPAGRDAVLSCVIAYNEHGGYCVPRASMHRQAAQRILAGEVWEPETLGLLCDLAADGDVVHAGTYFGDFLPAVGAAAVDSTVWAFEPNLESYRCAAVTKEMNGLSNVTLANAALGERPGTARLLIKGTAGRNLGGGSRIIDERQKEPDEHTARVDVVCIDDVVPPDRHVAVIQLDVEGQEAPALRGALRTIERCRPTLILETVPDHIHTLGYAVVGQAETNTVLRC